jgi:hypothetical protein
LPAIDNSYSRVEGMLYSYPKVKAEIENIKLDIDELNDVLGIKGASNNQIKPSTATYSFNSNVENEVIDRDDKIQNLNRMLRSKERHIKKIDNGLSTLTPDELKLVEMKYFRREKIDRIADVMDRSTDTIVRRRKDIILELINIL